MNSEEKKSFAEALIHKAMEFGAISAGVANVRDLKEAPSFVMMPKRPHMDRVGAVESTTGLAEGMVDWKAHLKSALIIAYEHPEEEPQLDYWLDQKNPPGNMALIRINRKLKEYVQEQYPQVEAVPLNYYVEKGGLWLKDSAVVAGMGTIGKNNLLVTPQVGPRVRLRAMFLSEDLPSSGPIDFDPCTGCNMVCRKSCPQQAFAGRHYDPQDYEGLQQLPGTDGTYWLASCDLQMAEDEANEDTTGTIIPGHGVTTSIVRYCRACEVNCRIGRKEDVK